MDNLGALSSYLELQPGTPVLSRQGQQVGTVRVVVADRDADIFDALVIDEEEGLRVALAEEVEAIHERGVVLALSTKQCHALPKPEPGPPEMSAGPRDTEPDRLRDRLRRAWELISGGP
ncbi:MAG: hypothetical protein QOI62_1763 [Solirubrobacteraceae bacterium]|nr:hypothetical protein [Solirubrobacteraceae bacterium]MEA2392219.1 hypothetical protein [Solirubrobacteraceae bacterium]